MLRSSVLLGALLQPLCSLAFPLFNTSDPEIAYQRSTFYIKGKYGEGTTGSKNGTFMAAPMYVEKLTPTAGVLHPVPIVFIPNQYTTGQMWLNTPDGRTGWASWFLSQGFSVYVVDTIYSGRSTAGPDGAFLPMTAENVERRYTAMEKFDDYPQAKLHNQWPGTGMRGDETFDQFTASLSDRINGVAPLWIQQYMQDAGVGLLERIGPAVLIGHDAGAANAWMVADKRPDLVKGIVALEPDGPVLEQDESPLVGRQFGVTSRALTFDPPVNSSSEHPLDVINVGANSTGTRSCYRQAEPARKLVNLAKVPVLLVTAEASMHATYDNCTVEFLKQAGVETTWMPLAKSDIRGNGHFFMLELNNIAIAKATKDWFLDTAKVGNYTSASDPTTLAGNPPASLTGKSPYPVANTKRSRINRW
ncbi:MAG: hypothetical protein M1814_005985 [Vezdaea aestivalis]|nr:MAG: hypothetical protein M1814_005985 [Vezdaea aestivalis]